MSKVIIIPCNTYEEETVFNLIKRGIDELGGISHFVNADERILVKPNFLSASAVEKAVTTHPAVISAVLRMLNEAGCRKVKCGDSPANHQSLSVARTIGLTEDKMYGAELACMNEEVKINFPEGKTAREFIVTKDVAEADAVINLCKMKTHALERITGAVKNLYGYICGTRKALGHVQYPDASVFARFLIDINRYKTPRLNIMDGIVAMEGNGPGSGDPIPMNVILISEDAVALDTVFCNLINLDKKLVPTIAQAINMGYGDSENIEVYVLDEECKETDIEDVVKHFGKADYNVDRSKIKKGIFAKSLTILSRYTRRPAIDVSKCIRCGACVNACPVDGKAVLFSKGKDKPPVYNYKKCIRCFCCQEICPQKAIKVIGLHK